MLVCTFRRETRTKKWTSSKTQALNRNKVAKTTEGKKHMFGHLQDLNILNKHPKRPPRKGHKIRKENKLASIKSSAPPQTVPKRIQLEQATEGEKNTSAKSGHAKPYPKTTIEKHIMRKKQPVISTTCRHPKRNQTEIRFIKQEKEGWRKKTRASRPSTKSGHPKK